MYLAHYFFTVFQNLLSFHGIATFMHKLYKFPHIQSKENQVFGPHMPYENTKSTLKRSVASNYK